MSYTVSDFFHTFSENLQLIAGQGGLAREINSCGILDYELLPELKDKYFHSNFQSGQFIVTSLLYARENPRVIAEAVKHLSSKGCSGLAIRNVLKLQIPEAVIRYADSKNFPVFLVNSVSLPFETIICSIDRQAALSRQTGYYQGILHHMLQQNLSPEEIRAEALRLNPSFSEQFFCACFRLDDFMTDSQKNQLILNFRSGNLSTCEDFVCIFRRDLLLIRSSETLQESFSDQFLRQFMEETFRGELVSLVGVSSMHNTLTELKQALQEAFFASVFLTREEEACRFRYFDRLGTYQILFPYCHTPEFAAFSRRITEKIEEYDTENNTHLLDTLLTYIQCDASLTETARQLSQHQQTIRYRLNKIYDLTGLDRKSPADCEQLSLAARIHIARRLLEGSV